MEQTSFMSDHDKIKSALEQALSNPEASQYLSVDLNKDESISIKAKSALAAKIKPGKKASYIEIKDEYVGVFKNHEITYPKKGSPRVKISDVGSVYQLTAQLSGIYMKTLAELGGEPFGCCHRYTACSDALKCLHPDYLTSLACAYKKNLDAGKVFYGKNKNI